MCLFTNRSCYSACIRVLPLYPFDLPYFSSQPRKVTICGRHVMASVRDKDCWGTSRAMPCLLFYETSLTLLKLRHYDFHVSRYGTRVSQVYSPYFPQWLDALQRRFSCCSLLILLDNRQNITDYEVYWLMGFPMINLWGACFTSKFSVFSVMAGWIARILFMLFFAYTAMYEHNMKHMSMKHTGLSVFQ